MIPVGVYRTWSEVITEIANEIDRGNEKHGDAPLASHVETISILVEELGEYAEAVMQRRPEDARKELTQLAAVAVNHLCGTGPHFSSK